MGSYNYLLVILSIFLASSASFFALHFASVAQHIVIEKYKTIALVSGSFIMAGGIWSMHFVGMLAYQLPLEMAAPLAHNFSLGLHLPLSLPTVSRR